VEPDPVPRPKSERAVLLSTLPAGARPSRLALGVVVVSAVFFTIAVPFARRPLTPVAAFIPIYESALVINDLITAALLFGQFSILRSPALLVLASGYLFTASMTVPHALTFPGLFAPTGLLGAGPQSTAWLYMLWHGGFPLFVIAYARLPVSRSAGSRPRGPAHIAALARAVGVLALAGGLTLLATAGHDSLPPIMIGNHYTPAMRTVVTTVWGLSLLALIVLWRRRRRSVLDLWLMVVMCAWLFDIALAAVLNAGRFDLGFYAGRIYGLLASGFVLVVLLLENGILYGRLLEARVRERRQRQRLEEKSAELMAANQELDAFSYSVSHDLRAPLRAIDGFSQILLEEHAGQLDGEGRRLLDVVSANARKMGQLIDDLLAFARLGRASVRRAPVDMRAMAGAVFAELVPGEPARARVELKLGPLPPASADPALMRQVWTNLLSNALKYSGGRERAVVEVSGERDGDRLVYRVRDNGVGFDPRYAEKLFGVFQRLHSSTEFEGTGVGLALVKRIAARHGGDVWADGTVGEGATFGFWLADQRQPPVNT
jgi:signal transduction histidine kinase